MFTGRWPHELSTRTNQPLDATFPTLAEYLRDRGYATAGFVANTFFCNQWYGLGRGFIHYEDTAVTPIEVLRSSALGKRLVKRWLRVLCHPLARSRWIALYEMDRATDDQRAAFLERVGKAFT